MKQTFSWPVLRPWMWLLLLFVVALIPRILYLGTFWGTDERYHWELSNEFFTALLNRDWANTIPQGLPGLTLAWIDSIALAIRYGWGWLISGGQITLDEVLANDRPYQLLGQRQIPVVLVNTLIVVGVYLLSRPILGRMAALFGIILVIFDPFLLAESRVLRFEGLVAGLMPLVLLAMLVYLKDRRRIFLILSAAIMALAMLTKISALILLPFIGLMIFAVQLSVTSQSTKSYVSQFFSQIFVSLRVYMPWLLLTLAFFWLFWPAMWVNPLVTLQEVWTFATQAGQGGFDGRGVFFWGQIYPDDPGLGFYPVALLFRLTPLTLLGLVVALIFVIGWAGQRAKIQDDSGWQWWGVVLLLLYSLFFMGAMMMGAKKYDRYLMPIFPTLDLVAGVGWFWLLTWVRSRWPQTNTQQAAIMAGGVLLLLIQAFTTLPHLPYYYTYYNPLFGGGAQAANFIRVGFAEGLDKVARYLETKPNAAELKVASANSSKLDGLFSGETIATDNLNGKWIQGDYVLIYISQRQRGKHSPDMLAYFARTTPEYELNLHGINYAQLYPGPAAQFYGGAHKLEGRGTLYGYDLSQTELQAGDDLDVTLYWRNEGQLEDDRFFVRLMDIDGYVWAEAIAQPRPGFEEAATAREAIVESEATLMLPPGMPPGDYFFKPGFRTEAGEIIGYFELPDEAKPLTVTALVDDPNVTAFQPPQATEFSLNADVLFKGFDLERSTVTSADSVWLTLYWQTLTNVQHDYVILLRLVDDAEQELAFWLGRPVRSGYPSLEWQAQQLVQDPWRLEIPAETTLGRYRLELAVFDAESQAELARQTLTEILVEGE